MVVIEGQKLCCVEIKSPKNTSIRNQKYEKSQKSCNLQFLGCRGQIAFRTAFFFCCQQL